MTLNVVSLVLRGNSNAATKLRICIPRILGNIYNSIYNGDVVNSLTIIGVLKNLIALVEKGTLLEVALTKDGEYDVLTIKVRTE